MDYFNQWYDIFQLLNFKSQLTFIMVTSQCKKNLHITDMCTIERGYNPKPYLNRITEEVLAWGIFKHVRKFDNKNNITDLRSLKNLKILKQDYDDKMDMKKFNELDLIKLDIYGNEKIRDLTRMTNLKKLRIHIRTCISGGLTQEGIHGLNLVKFSLNSHYNITDVSFMKNLKVLVACGSRCGIDQHGIRGLDLTSLDCGCNSKITDVSFMRNLKSLRIAFDSGIGQQGIQGLNLYLLDASYNPKITDVSFMRNLKILYTGPGIDQKVIKNLDLIQLYAEDNENIVDVSFMRNLKYRVNF